MSSLETELQAQRTKAQAQWRELAQSAARGGSEPALSAVQKLAGVLGLDLAEAVTKFRTDCERIAEYDLAVITADSAQTRVVQALEPFEGSAEQLHRVVAEANQRAQDLRDLLEDFNDSTVPAAARARTQRDQLAKQYADIL